MPKNSHLIVKSLVRKNTSLIFTISLASMIALSGFSIILDDSEAQMFVEVGDFFCWDFTGPVSTFTPTLGLNDQIQDKEYTSFTPLEFCESSDKDLGANSMNITPSPFDGTGTTAGQHYTTYDITGPSVDQVVTITVSNFSPDYVSQVTIRDPAELWVPNTKCISDTGACLEVFSEDPNRHFICYNISGAVQSTEPPMKFIHQFGDNTFTIDTPFLLCNPVDKDLPGTTGIGFEPDFPKIGDVNHLVCFNISGVTGVTPIVMGLRDQVGTVSGTNPYISLIDDKACFEAFKTLGQLSGTAQFINGAALLVAGSQMIAAWIIPFVVAAVGIGIVVARKY